MASDPDQSILDFLSGPGQTPVDQPPPPPTPAPTPEVLADVNAALFAAVDPPPVTADNFAALSGVTAFPLNQQAFVQQYAPQMKGGNLMPNKIILFQAFTRTDYQISETWYSAGPPTLSQIVAYCAAKRAISGTNTLIDRVRVSTIGTRFAVALYTADMLRAGGLPGIGGTFTGATPDPGSADPDEALDITCKCTSVAGAPVRVKRYQLRGIPDSIIGNGGLYQDPGGYTNLFRLYANAIKTNGWGWYGQPPAPVRTPILNVTQANGVVTFTLNAAGFPNPPAGGTINVSARIRNMPSPWRFFNGSITLTVQSTTVATSLRIWPFPNGAYPANSATMQVTSVTPTSQFYPVDLTDPAVAGSGMQIAGVGERKAGKNNALHPGRRRNRVFS